MIAAGDIVLFRFPQTDLRIGKLRPALLLKELPGGFDDWLVCMISSQMHQEIPGLDLTLLPGTPDFAATGL
jgi:mRNA interferase MazF